MTEKIKIPAGKYLFKQDIEINSSKKEIKILVGIGMLNSNDELSINIPLDFLMIVESLKSIIELLKEKKLQLLITIWFGDKNAEILLKEKEKFTEENKKIWDSTKEIYKEKIMKIFENSGGFDVNKINYFYGSDLYNNEEYRAYCDNLSRTIQFGDDITCYSVEQLYVMHYFKNKLGYDLRLSWAKKYKPNKNCNDRDEEGIDKQYEETFHEKPITSIYFKHGLKLSDSEGGLGIAVPYSFFPSEINQRIPFDSNVTLEQIEYFFDSLNEKSIKKFQDLYTNGKKSGENSAEYILHRIMALLK
jgi:hypothetical protein